MSFYRFPFQKKKDPRKETNLEEFMLLQSLQVQPCKPSYLGGDFMFFLRGYNYVTMFHFYLYFWKRSKFNIVQMGWYHSIIAFYLSKNDPIRLTDFSVDRFWGLVDIQPQT